MIQYKRLSLVEREKIQALYNYGCHITEIADNIGRHKSSISREIRRFAKGALYDASRADTLYCSKLSRNKDKFANPALLEYVASKLVIDRWSPKAIAGRLKLSPSPGGLPSVSHETIYKFIFSKEGAILSLKGYLRRHKKKRGLFKRHLNKKPGIRDLVPISERPSYVDTRREFGHCEGDLLILSSTEKRNIISVVERKSRYCWLIDNYSKASNPVIGKIRSAFKASSKSIKSITFDRGKEFAYHKNLGIDTYFCNPHSPWQKGSVENLNGRIRALLPKNASARHVDTHTIDWIQNILNNTPMKVLGYHTPLEIFNRAKDRAVALEV